ncbi:hypothetical protein AAUPMB_08414 [Pasteurella multocida subsp. multocida str. Anand1_buffalo]|nr:hypothetical protein AAUPMB_08414 [Pasteurella multocida subsp. multocida str. Anand1_buffalo]
MIKYILGLVLVLAIVLVAITIGANNDQIISFNYMVAQSEFRLSTFSGDFIRFRFDFRLVN